MGCEGNLNWSIWAPPLNAIPPEELNLQNSISTSLDWR